MENSINFLHSFDAIKTSSDGLLFEKQSDQWKQINSVLYKSEYNKPDNSIGNDGDYYAYYTRKYNYILHSEDFLNNSWIKNNCKVELHPSLTFPKSNATRLENTTNNSSHGLDYVFSNKMGQIYTFSLYVLPETIRNIALKISDYDDNCYAIIKVNLDDQHSESKPFTISSYINKEKLIAQGIDPNKVNNAITSINGNAIKYNEEVARIWITASLALSPFIKASILLLDKNDNEVFSTEAPHGLYINSAQLVLSESPEDYIKSDKKASTAISLKSLYHKQNNKWAIIPNNIYYFDTITDLNIGKSGDIGCIDSLMKFEPLIIVGNATNITKRERPIGTIYYNNKKDKWYVRTPKGEYSLEMVKPSSNNKDIAMAITLNQQTYQSYNRHGKVSHFKGYNTGGQYNFWNRNYGLKKL